jgi:hypothetical protein
MNGLNLPIDIVNIIFKYLELDLQWKLHKQPKWTKNWE